MTTYTSIPTEVEALEVPGLFAIDARLEFEQWIEGLNMSPFITWVGNGIRVRTPNGDAYVAPGDYIIYIGNEDIYPCNRDVFEKKYVKV